MNIPWGAIVTAVIAFLKELFSCKPKYVETEVAEHALAAKQHEAEILAAPVPPDDALDDIVRRHQPR